MDKNSKNRGSFLLFFIEAMKAESYTGIILQKRRKQYEK